MIPTRLVCIDRLIWCGGLSGLFLATSVPITPAQVAGDGSLGTQVNGSTIAPCTGVCSITNGTLRGANLFHSLRQFSLPNGDFAGFVTTPTIQNVIVRVTGVGRPFISNINGTIATSNPANVFLLNPNGILFGPGATLNIGGSFLATTAQRMQFADGTEFRTTDPAPLLTISVPTGLQFGRTPGAIQVRGSRFLAGQTDSFSDFALIGGPVTLDTTFIQARGQRVELGGMQDAQSIGLTVQGNQLRLNTPSGTARSDIWIRNSLVNVAAAGSGEIALTGRNLNLLSSSILNAGIRPGANAAGVPAGNITLNATGAVTVAGSYVQNAVGTGAIGEGGHVIIRAKSLTLTNAGQLTALTLGQGNAGQVLIQTQDAVTFTGGSTLFNTVEPGAIGNSGGVAIQAGTITMTQGAEIQASTSGQGNAGDVTLQVRDRIAFDGVDANDFASGIFSTVKPGARGNGGTIRMTTGSLSLTNGGRIQTNIRDRGNAGNVIVQASGDVTIDGFGTTDPSEIATTVGTGGIGRGGDIQIRAKSLVVTHGGSVNANTFGYGQGGNVSVEADRVILDGVDAKQRFASSLSSEVGFDRSAGIGNGGNINVLTRSLSITNGAGISTSTRAQGNAGNIFVQASESVSLGGTSRAGLASILFSAVGPGAIGNGGQITINTNRLTLQQGAQISSSSEGNGSAGSITSHVHRMSLDSQSRLTTETTSGNGGNIDLNIQDLLLLRRGSLISTTAGTAQAGGDGGNITIDVPQGFVVAAPLENSDITANAFSGSGGSIAINAQGIFWLVPRDRPELERLLGSPPLDPQRLPTNDITASSQFGLSGSIILNILNVDPSRGLVALPTSLTDASRQVVQTCTPGSKTSSGNFVATGRGGIPLSPDGPLKQPTVVTSWIGLSGEEQPTSLSSPIPPQPNSQAIVEAQSWRIHTDGSIELVADPVRADRPYGIPLPTCSSASAH